MPRSVAERAWLASQLKSEFPAKLNHEIRTVDKIDCDLLLKPSPPDDRVFSSHARVPKMMKILDEFVAGLPAQVVKMTHLLETKDFVSLRRVAHQLRGAGGGYGFPHLTELGRNLEESIKEGMEEESIASRTESLVRFIHRIEGYDQSAEWPGD